MAELRDVHIGRSWQGHPLEDECPCPQARCGLVIQSQVTDCPQHSFLGAKSMRQGHEARYCPARPAPMRWGVKLSDAVAKRRERRRLRRLARWKLDWRHPIASLGMALGFGPHADGQAQLEIVSRVRWAASHFLCIGKWFWDGKDDCWRCGAQPSDVDFLMRRVGFRRAECFDADECRSLAAENDLGPQPNQKGAGE